MKRCPNCAKTFSDEARFCSNCGASLEGGGPPARSEVRDSTVAQGVHDSIIAQEGSAVAETVAVVGNVRDINVGVGARDEEARARARYLTKLHQRCNVLPLAALGGEEGVGDEVTLDEVYVALDTRTRVPMDEEERQQAQGSLRGEDARALSALEAVAQTRRLVLLGDPGSGKSTFVRQVVARLAVGHLAPARQAMPVPAWETAPPLPLLVTLRELAPRLTDLALEGMPRAQREAALVAALWAYWEAGLTGFRAEAWIPCLEDALTEGRVLLVCDGLDEVAPAARGLVRDTVHALLRAYPDLMHIIVTCRIRSYRGDAVLPGFTAHTLAPFDEDKVRAFVAAWYAAQARLGRVGDDAAAERTADLQGAALDRDLRELASNPMLLTTMAIIHQREVGLPRERVRLYALAVQVLLHRWQRHKGVKVPKALADILGDDQRLRALLEKLAYEAHRREATFVILSAAEESVTPSAAEESQDASLQRRDLLSLLEQPAYPYLGDPGLAGAFLDYVDQRAGLLVGHGGDAAGGYPQTYAFPHRTFQEYLAGCAMVSQRRRGMVREYLRRAAEGDPWYLAARLGSEELLYNRRRPEELLDLAYGLAPEAAPTDERGWRATLWSGLMAALLGPEAVARDMERPDGGRAYLDRLIPRLLHIMREAPLGAVERVEAGDVVAKLGDPRFRPDAWYLPDEPLLGFVEIPAGAFLMGTDESDIPQLMEQLGGERMWYEREVPRHWVKLPTYYIARYPVTVAQFRAFVEASGVQPQDADSLRGVANHPVVWVTWHEALAYCRWLTDVLRDWQGTPEPLARLLREGWQMMLPSEAEWEKAAAWDAAKEEAMRYPWGDEPDPERANYGDTGIGATSAVGCFRDGASGYGVEDLSGNVWEWTRSLWGGSFSAPDFKYPYDVGDGREDLTAGDGVLRVVRGGSFFASGRYVRCAYRLRLRPYYVYNYYGFRVALVSPSFSAL